MFAVYGGNRDDPGTVAEVTMSTCSFTDLGKSPQRMRSTVTSIGDELYAGQCASVPTAKKIMWVAGNVTHLKLVSFDYEKKNFTSTPIKGFSKDWKEGDSHTLLGLDTFAVLMMGNDYFVIDKFDTPTPRVSPLRQHHVSAPSSANCTVPHKCQPGKHNLFRQLPGRGR